MERSLNALKVFVFAGALLVTALAVLIFGTAGSTSAKALTGVETGANSESLQITKDGPASALAGHLITYTLEILNSTSITLTEVVITDTIPTGAHYAAGGTLVGDVVSWTVPSLKSGASIARQFSVTADRTITNDDYRVSSNEGYSAIGQDAVVTNIEHRVYLPVILKLAPSVTKELIATHDSCVLQGYPTLNLGDTTDMWAGYDDYLDPDGKIARSLVRSNLSSIPVGAHIQEAKLFLYLVGSWDFPDRYRTITIHRATSSWSESSVTWNSRPGYGEQYAAVSIRESAWGWYGFDITALVQGWVDGGFANHGLVVRGPEQSGTDSSWRAFGTSESSDKPFIRIAYLSGTSAEAVGAPDFEAGEQHSGTSIHDLMTSDAQTTSLPKVLSWSNRD